MVLVETFQGQIVHSSGINIFALYRILQYFKSFFRLIESLVEAFDCVEMHLFYHKHLRIVLQEYTAIGSNFKDSVPEEILFL